MNRFDCARTTRWLDEAGDDAESALVAAHAASCASCSARVEAGRAVLTLLTSSAAPVLPAAGFAMRVRARIAATAQDPPAESVAAARARAAFELALRRDAFPWWVRAATQPACALALVLAAFAIVFAAPIARTAQSAPQWSAAAFALVTGALAPWLARVGTDPVAGTGLALALVPLVLLLSRVLFRLGASWTTVRVEPLPAGRDPRLPGA
jgi:hypothetical protein